MKRIAGCTLVLLALGAVRAAVPDDDQLFKDSVACLTEVRDVLKPVKDRASAEAALPKLKALAKRMEQVENAARRLPRDKAEAWKKEHGKALKPLAQEAERESARVESLPEVYAVLRASPLFEARRRHMETVARLGVQLLESNVKVYHLDKGSYPADLSALVKAGYYEGENPKDPWGRPYVYDPKTVHPKSGVPLIYSQGANPTDPKGRISNFVPGKEKPGK